VFILLEVNEIITKKLVLYISPQYHYVRTTSA